MQILGEAFIPTVEYGGADYGSSLLKSLQTEKLPELDLLVRESIQNSSDASIGIDHKNFHIDYTYSEFHADRLCEHLGEVGQKIISAGLGSNFFLEIRDTKTTGLTGPYNTGDLDENDHGNYFKLIFDTGINQTQQGAGGNWGFGKSVYYRVSGAGVVVFYSRIKQDDEYEDRLIVAMVEDQESESGILRGIRNNPTGRAWWGRPGTEKDVVWPIVDREKIAAFLNLFDLKPFKETETGTAVIIPFLNEEKLLSDILPHDDISDDERNRFIWKESVPEYLKYAIQKWYAPRLRNKELESLPGNNKWIRATVNGKLLKNNEEMNPFFKLVQELYNAAVFQCMGKEYKSTLFPIEVAEIKLKEEGLESSNVGYVSFVKVTRKDIFGHRAGMSPYVLTGNFKNSDEENEPIVMFAREPGMVIGYSIDGTWSRGVKAPSKNAGSSSDEYIVAFFVPRVGNAFKPAGDDDRARLFGNLGGYLRKCEESDHASWEDKARYRLIRKIKTNTGKKIAACNEDEVSMIDASASRLAGRITKALMPAKGYLVTSSAKKPDGHTSGEASRCAKMVFTTLDPHWQDGRIVVPYTLVMGDRDRVQLRIEAQTESGTLTAENWKRDIGTDFPLSIASATVELSGSMPVSDNRVVVTPGMESRNGTIFASLGLSDGDASVLFIVCDAPSQTIKGELELQSSDRAIECAIKVL